MSRITVRTQERRFPTAPNLYGLFFEDINRAGDGGLYPEMLRNRSFEDSIPPERCVTDEGKNAFTTPMGWSDQFHNGEGLERWMRGLAPTPVPAWYADRAAMTLDASQRLNPRRLTALRVDFAAGGSIWNIGYRGVPLKKGERYDGYLFAKAKGDAAEVEASIVSEDGTVQDRARLTIEPGGYRRYDVSFTAAADDWNGRFCLKAERECTVYLGFTSLMPRETYKGHGMRKDLMEMLEHTSAKFLRFPGGCIVEGFTYETAMRFSNTIGPVWERPSQVLMWHYRTTNGLGFHEYLQICEDLGLEPMYVVNCGLTCQGREPEFFEGEALDQLLQEAMDAVEYAIGDVSTPMGKKRAEAGHPEPFGMKYIEIGNENSGEEYFCRYQKFYDALKEKYPQIRYIANVHTEQEGLPTEMADEHYYDTPEFFAENTHFYDGYDRSGPEIFVGEYAVTVGKTATLFGALAESMFLLGCERNQDIVTATAYAPLFQNVDYTAWYPNLIAYDNHRVYGIPSYHALSMLAGNRGQEVAAVELETRELHRVPCGLPGIFAEHGGLRARRILLDGAPAGLARQLQGRFDREGDAWAAVSTPPARSGYVQPDNPRKDDAVFALFGDGEKNKYTFEAEIAAGPDGEVSVAVWCCRPFQVFRVDETADPDLWDLDSSRCFLWTVGNGSSSVSEFYHRRHHARSGRAGAEILPGDYHHYRVVAREDGFDCYLDGERIHQVRVPAYPAVTASAETGGGVVTVKLVNITDQPEPVELELDCPVCPEYEAAVLTHPDPEAENSLEEPERVAPVTLEQTGAAQRFVYQAPAYSLSVLRLKQK